MSGLFPVSLVNFASVAMGSGSKPVPRHPAMGRLITKPKAEVSQNTTSSGETDSDSPSQRQAAEAVGQDQPGADVGEDEDVVSLGLDEEEEEAEESDDEPPELVSEEGDSSGQGITEDPDAGEVTDSDKENVPPVPVKPTAAVEKEPSVSKLPPLQQREDPYPTLHNGQLPQLLEPGGYVLRPKALCGHYERLYRERSSRMAQRRSYREQPPMTRELITIINAGMHQMARFMDELIEEMQRIERKVELVKVSIDGTQQAAERQQSAVFDRVAVVERSLEEHFNQLAALRSQVTVSPADAARIVGNLHRSMARVSGFSGERSNARSGQIELVGLTEATDWLSATRTKLAAQKFPEDEMVRIAFTHLEGTAARLMQDRSDADDFLVKGTSWQRFAETIRSYFKGGSVPELEARR